MKIGFVGLGVMGFPMAGHLAKAGFSVMVWNRTTEKSQKWARQYGGEIAQSPASLAELVDLAITCVGNDSDIASVILGENGLLKGAHPSLLIIDHSTVSAKISRELGSATNKRGVSFMDAPISGGQIGAETGKLTIMAGGRGEDFERARPAMEAYSKAYVHIGPVGSGQLAKMVNQICIAGIVQGLAEALNFAEKADLDISRVIEAIAKGAAQSWQMDNRWKTMKEGEFNFGFAVDWMRKDLGICLDEARQNGARLPITALVDQFYAQIQARGGQRWDTSSLIDLLRNP